MPTIGSVTKTIRFNPSDLGIIEDIMKKEDTTFNNAVHLLIENGGTPKNQPKIDRGTPENKEKTEKRGTPKGNYELIGEMANLMRVPTEKLLDDIKGLLEEGTLYYSNGKLVNPRYEEFERLCELKKQDADKMINNVVRQMGG